MKEEQTISEACYKKGRSDICHKESRSRRAILEVSIPVLVPREAKERERPHVQNDAQIQPLLLFSPSFFFAPASSPSLSRCLSSGLVRKHSHSQKTQNAEGHVSRRQQSSLRKGLRKKREKEKRERERKRERGRQEYVRVYACRGARHCLYSRRSSSRYVEGGCRRFRYFGTERHCPSTIKVQVVKIEFIGIQIKKNKIVF